MTQRLTLEWDLGALDAALLMSEGDTARYFRDGRRISFVLERRLKQHFAGWQLAPSENSGYDLVDAKGTCWEVRSLSRIIYFCPSYMVGSGRRFDERGFLDKLLAIGGFICADITGFPAVPVYIVRAAMVRDLYRTGVLGKSASISRASFLSRIVPRLKPPAFAL